MTQKALFKNHLSITLFAVFAVFGLVILSQTAFALPTQSPPNGNPLIPPGPQGIQGPQGPQGNTGGQGNAGQQGAQGPVGPAGTVACNWSGKLWLTNGNDGGCAWQTGIYLECNGGRSYSTNGYIGNWPCGQGR